LARRALSPNIRHSGLQVRADARTGGCGSAKDRGRNACGGSWTLRAYTEALRYLNGSFAPALLNAPLPRAAELSILALCCPRGLLQGQKPAKGRFSGP
jgi:hypothetical protein